MKNKIYKVFVKLGKIFFTINVLIVTSIIIQSFTIKGKANYGDRCYLSDSYEFIDKYKYEGINLKEANLKCNTYYLRYESRLDNKENILFLNSLSKLLQENNTNIDLQVYIVNNDSQIIASVVDYSINYVESFYN